MAERIVLLRRPLRDVILSLTGSIQGQDLVDLVSKTGRTDIGVKRVVDKLIKEGKVVNKVGRYSSHPALTV